MLASLLRFITLALAALACGWLLYFLGQRQSALAWAGFLVLTLGYAAVLGLEILLLWWIGRYDPAPRPRAAELLSAWWGEVVTSPQVFCWRQPFRSMQIADQLGPPEQVRGRRGVVLVHGFFCNRGLWTPWLARLQASGHAFVAPNLEPLFGSIDEYVPQIEDAVERVTRATGLAPLLVCHSMGGLAARAWLRQMKADARVHHIVTIGTPHQGAWLARFGHGINGRQMRLGADWRTQLDHGMPASRPALFTCWYSNCDNLVFPVSNATLPGARNRLVRGKAHVQLAFAAQLMDETLALLDE